MLAKVGFKNYLIPMWNSTFLTKNLLLSGVSTTEILITCAINIVFGILCLGIVSRLFNNEKIVNDMRKRVITIKKGVVISDEEKGGYIDEDY